MSEPTNPEPSPQWILEPSGTAEDHWVDFVDPGGWYSASVKWDGCVHFYRYFNQPHPQPKDDPTAYAQHLHICDIDEEIARLQALKAKAIEYFAERGGWPR